MSPRPVASVVVRAKNKVDSIERTLRAVRAQSTAAELIVVDSGSTDGTLEVAHALADRVVQIPPGHFSYGRALNIGARAASGEIHFALSAHSVPASDTWIADSLRYYERSDVMGANFARRSPDGTDLGTAAYYQTPADVLANPRWGFSNHGSSWRASAWRELPFREDLAAAEDKEWSWRVLARGWTIAFAPELQVSSDHRRRAGLVAFTRRIHRERSTVIGLGGFPRPSLADTVDEWWAPDHHPDYPPLLLRRASPFRLAEIAATYWAGRTAPEIPSSIEGLRQAMAAEGSLHRDPVAASGASRLL